MQKRLTEQGLRYLEEGRFDKAGQILSLLIKSFPDNADAHHMLGIIALEKGDLEASYILVNTAIDIMPDNPMFYNTLGNIELHRKNIDQSEISFLRAIELAPEKIEYKYNLAHFYLTQNKYDKAIDYYYYILHTNPTHYLSIRGITVCYLFSGETEIALEHANEWVAEYDNYYEAYYYQGLCLYAMNNITGALAAYDRGLDLMPTSQDILTAIGACYRSLGNFNIAETYLHKSLTIDSNNPTAIYHLACIKLDKGEIGSAYDLFQNAIKLNDQYAEPICGLGCIELTKGNEDSALAYFNSAEIVEPTNIKSKLLIATTLLRLKRFKEGWQAYNQVTSAINDDLINQILFSSMLNDAQTEFSNAIIQCDNRLVKILQTSFPQFKIVSNTDGITKQVALKSLGQFYRLKATDFNRAKIPYLAPDPNRAQYYEAKYQQLFQDKKLIGIAWRSVSSTNTVEHIKSSHLSAWQDILRKSNCQFISLQAGDISNELKNMNSSIRNNVYVDPEVKLDNKADLSELCAQMSALDLVISIDSYTAHLAGAMGLNVHIILPVQAEWYWFKDQDTSTFYPNMSIFRQKIANDWSAPLKDLAKLI